MGNSAAKILDETKLCGGTFKEDDDRSIAKTLITTTDGTVRIKNKDKSWVRYNNGGSEDDDAEILLWSYKHAGGMFKSHSLILDSEGKQVAAIITAKKGMASCTNFVCRSAPSYESQNSLTDEELKKAGMSPGETWYKFAKFETTRKLTTAKCTYGLVVAAGAAENEEKTTKALYEGEKLSSVGFRAIFREVGSGDGDVEGAAIAKAYTRGLSMSPRLDAASGVDLLAIVSMGYALAGDESSAGALAGAGVA